ncbi:type IV toxin-antitoxin system AbiEi family antitoxin domain-containing protein [Deinococcus sp.]|uniref:type IV toxin-antitoxin system AbiEi family antitoxin domain-containing protein n=1 Tax=Deinococcus sp. TaxID=47478 RepID=UPI0025EE1FD7|nr:type IV toxin-antitoxin system AbiEi family antitoxin domain-containing protein [Deinococcus sp.]
MPTTKTTPDQLLDLFQAQGGLLTARAARQAGLPSMAITRLLEKGLIERIQRGVYRLTDESELPTADLEALDLLEVQLRSPYARPCLVSALHLHGLSTTRPAALQLAIPRHRHRPRIETPQTEFFFFGPRAYGTGLTTLDVRGQALVTYSPEKTLTDLLRYAPKFGRELYLEGLKKYLGRRAVPLYRLTEAARDAGVWTAMSRDLEVLLHDQDH